MYSFDAEDTTELAVARGDIVILVTPHGQLGSSEWWLVAKDNTEGYVPSDYLELANEDEGSHEVSQERSPESRVRSPELLERLTEPQLRSPDPQERSPESQDISTEHIYEVSSKGTSR